MTEASVGLAPTECPKEASRAVIAQHEAVLKALPFDDTADFDDAARGFLGTIENAKITSPQGRVVWSLEPYGFMSQATAPPTVNPSLWRQARLNMQHGLFEVVPGVYQVRGLDIANMTLIEGDSGVIVVDTLTSIEGARASMELYFKHRGARPLAAVVFTHTHTDHWGGARGVLSEKMLAGAGRSRSLRRTCSWSMRSPRTLSRGPRCCAARNTSSDRSWRRGRSDRSIAGWASRWRPGRWRWCVPTT